MSEDQVGLVEEDAVDAVLEARKKTLEATLEELKGVLVNTDGVGRLEAITDEEWEAAEEADRAAGGE
jgi:hypothetical protein